MSQSEQRLIKAAGTGEPKEGRLCLSYSLDLSTGAKAIALSEEADKISSVRGIYVNNSSAKDVSAVVDSSSQKMIFPSNTESYLPVVGSLPLSIMFTPAALPIDKNIGVSIVNFELPFSIGDV